MLSAFVPANILALETISASCTQVPTHLQIPSTKTIEVSKACSKKSKKKQHQNRSTSLIVLICSVSSLNAKSSYNNASSPSFLTWFPTVWRLGNSS